MRRLRLICLLSALALLPGALSAEPLPSPQSSAQGTPIYLEPLFEYPVAPETLEGLTERCNWLVEHFWEPLDIKNKNTVNQAALNHAFGVYAACLDWATPSVVEKSTAALTKKLMKNPTLLIQMIKAAEENMYGPRAAVWRDEAFAMWLRAGVECKKIDRTRRTRYADTLRRLEASMVGKHAPSFDFTAPDGSKGRYFAMSTPTILFFGDPDCVDCSRERLRLETDVTLSRLVDQGRANVIYIVTDPQSPDWQGKVAGIPSTWAVGAAEVDDVYDLRPTPSIYVVDREGKIAAKFLPARESAALMSEILNTTNPQ